MNHIDPSITAAIIAGIVSLAGLVATKEQKITEFRQEWINELRKDIAQLLSDIIYFDLLYKDAKINIISNNNFLITNKDLSKQIIHTYQIIKLRLNPKDNDGLIQLLDELIEVVTKPSKLNLNGEIESVFEAFEERAHEILKGEWERVKTGEAWFRWTKIVILISSVLLLVYSLNQTS